MMMSICLLVMNIILKLARTVISERADKCFLKTSTSDHISSKRNVMTKLVLPYNCVYVQSKIR